MDLMKQKNKKIGPIKDISNKFKYTFDGILYGFKNESSFILITIGFVALIIMGIIFHLSFNEWLISMGSLFLIMMVEFLNTGIEAAVDLVTNKFNKFAKIAKDCGSAATFIAIIICIFVMIMIFIPKIFPGLI